MDRLRRILNLRLAIFFVWILGFVFFARNAHLQLATDDLAWLRGVAPTVFDQYRLIPHLFFILLYKIAGPSPIAALAIIFIFHSVNMILVGLLASKLFEDSIATITSACIFMINPLTLSTLTWISCFSYVLGTTMALLSILLFWRGCIGSKAWLWWIGAVAFYSVGLFCSHEILFVPIIFFLLGWLYGEHRFVQSSLVSIIAMIMGLIVNIYFYNFEHYGVETVRLFHLDFVSAFVSSTLSFGLSLGVAYLLSFFVSPTGFLQFAFSEPVRWNITLLLFTSTLFVYKPNKSWRNWLALVVSFIALITPYILRLYLMPKSVNYDISYLLAGRVFYLPFVVIALAGGALISQLFWSHLKNHSLGVLFQTLPMVAYLYALCVLYSPKDFMGLSVVQGISQSTSPSWNPYHGSQSAWLASLMLMPVFAYIRQVFIRRSS